MECLIILKTVTQGANMSSSDTVNVQTHIIDVKRDFSEDDFVVIIPKLFPYLSKYKNFHEGMQNVREQLKTRNFAQAIFTGAGIRYEIIVVPPKFN